MYLPPNPLKGNREKFDNVQISRKSKVENSRVSNYSKPETQTFKLFSEHGTRNSSILNSQLSIVSATRNPKLVTRNSFI